MGDQQGCRDGNQYPRNDDGYFHNVAEMYVIGRLVP